MGVDHAGLFDLTGKVAVVTGGSRGLGLEMAFAFARQGADVVIASRKLETCEEVAAAIAEETGRRTAAVRFHAASWADCDGLADAVYSGFGRVDVLVNNAGMSPLYPSLSSISEDMFDKVLGVNLKGPFRLSAVVGERMVADGGGSIINVSSVAAVEPRPTELVYACAKAGLHALTTGLARAYGPSVRANTIMAGPFRTDISKAWDMETMERFVQRDVPLKRIGEPSEIVGAALYLAGEAASFTTGAVIKVAGGLGFPAG